MTIEEKRYKDLQDYFSDKDCAKTILENDDEFKKWLERLKWHVKKCDELAMELKAHKEAWDKCIKEIKEWYWNADKQAIAKDSCVVDAMVDLFIRTIKECRPKEGYKDE